MISLFLLLIIILDPFHKAIASSPSFELQQLINENHRWVQTYGKSAHILSLTILTYKR